MPTRICRSLFVIALSLSAAAFAAEPVDTPQPPAPIVSLPPVPACSAEQGCRLLSSDAYAKGAAPAELPTTTVAPCPLSVAYQRASFAEGAAKHDNARHSYRRSLQHLRIAADHLEAAGDHGDFKELAGHLRERADALERDAAARLKELRKQAEKIRLEIEDVERLTSQNNHLMFRVSVLEVDEKKLQEAGIDIQFLTGISKVNGSIVQRGHQAEDLMRQMEKLKKTGVMKVLAIPDLVMKSGSKSAVHSGGKFPILVSQDDGTTKTEIREFGVRIEVKPHVLENGRLRLKLTPEISELNFTESRINKGVMIPRVRTRRIKADVEMSFGETLLIRGCRPRKVPSQAAKELSRVTDTLVQQVSGSETPQPTETSLIIMVTPETVTQIRFPL